MLKVTKLRYIIYCLWLKLCILKYYYVINRKNITTFSDHGRPAKVVLNLKQLVKCYLMICCLSYSFKFSQRSDSSWPEQTVGTNFMTIERYLNSEIWNEFQSLQLWIHSLDSFYFFKSSQLWILCSLILKSIFSVEINFTKE